MGALTAALHAQPVAMDSLVVTADRTPEPASQVAWSVTSLSAETLASAPALTLDDALRSVPSFSLFRRDGSLTANPTTQGVSLRGLGPSGASRSLVLLDGLPVNDPFGGWITWSQIPKTALAGAEIVAGGGATAWGNSALGGVVQLLTDPLAGRRERLDASIGAYVTRSAEFELTEPAGSGTVQLLGSAFATDGYRIVAPANAGPIDVPAASQHSWLSARWREPLTAGLEAVLTLHTFEEARNNGTPYQVNATRENQAALAFNGTVTPNFSWTGTAYAQNGDFASTYSSVNAARTVETPAENQFAVPDTAVGGAWTGTWRDHAAITNLGFDVRDIRGETREDYSFANGDYADRRFAGGGQSFFGAFALREQPVARGFRLSLGIRLDRWEQFGGHLRQWVRTTGASLGDSEYSEREGVEFSPSFGAIWQLATGWKLHADVQRGFRVPTLNELYRPFRQGNNVTEANPALQAEHVTSAEIGADWTRGGLRMGIAGFGSELRNAVDAVTIATGPANVPGVGSIPAGGTGLERLNLDVVRVGGVQTYAEWQPGASWRIRADYLFDDTKIVRASVAPSLAGNQLVQVPRESATLQVNWSGPWGVVVAPRVRWTSLQYTDDQNLLPLTAVAVVDLTVSYALSEHFRVFLTAENLGDATVETALSTTGVISTGTPRLVFGGIRFER